MAHALCVLNTEDYKHTLRICNTYCFSTATGFQESASMLSYSYISCLVISYCWPVSRSFFVEMPTEHCEKCLATTVSNNITNERLQVNAFTYHNHFLSQLSVFWDALDKLALLSFSCAPHLVIARHKICFIYHLYFLYLFKDN